jgi:hypothetical protein
MRPVGVSAIRRWHYFQAGISAHCVVRLPKIEPTATTMTQTKPSRIRPPKVVRQKLRSLAVDHVRKDIIHAGRKEEDYSAEDLEYLVADKEKEIWSGIGWKSFGVVALLLGINIGI